MNLTTHKFMYALVLCALAFNVRAAEPLEVAISRLENAPRIDVVVTGVLGYTNDCEFALYPDRVSALTRRADNAVILLVDEKSSAISDGATLDQSVNSYVLAKGVLSRRSASGGAPILSSPLIYYAFAKAYEYTGHSTCSRFFGEKALSIEALLKNRQVVRGSNVRVTVYGILKKSDDGAYQLYGSKEAAENDVWVHAIDVIFKSPQAHCFGREYLIEGIPKTPRRRSGVQIVLRDAKVIASACSG